jgi:predicted CopG family antitoxin
MKNIKFSDETYNLLVLLKKEESFESLLNKMANYFIKSELDVFNLRPYAEETILKELQTIKKEQERTIKIIKAQEKDYKALFASKNDLQNIKVSNDRSEIITIEDLQNNGMTQDELLSLIDAANENNRVIARQKIQIEELEKKLASRLDDKQNTSSTHVSEEQAELEDSLIQMSFSEAIRELIKHERTKPSEQREYDKEIFEKMKVVLDASVQIENDNIQEAYKAFISTLEYFDMIKVYWTDDITTEPYLKAKNHLLSLL